MSFVPGAGVEPARTCVHWCLRPARLPIPPSRRLKIGLAKIDNSFIYTKFYAKNYPVFDNMFG